MNRIYERLASIRNAVIGFQRVLFVLILFSAFFGNSAEALVTPPEQRASQWWDQRLGQWPQAAPSETSLALAFFSRAARRFPRPVRPHISVSSAEDYTFLRQGEGYWVLTESFLESWEEAAVALYWTGLFLAEEALGWSPSDPPPRDWPWQGILPGAATRTFPGLGTYTLDRPLLAAAPVARTQLMEAQNLFFPWLRQQGVDPVEAHKLVQEYINRLCWYHRSGTLQFSLSDLCHRYGEALRMPLSTSLGGQNERSSRAESSGMEAKEPTLVEQWSLARKQIAASRSGRVGYAGPELHFYPFVSTLVTENRDPKQLRYRWRRMVSSLEGGGAPQVWLDSKGAKRAFRYGELYLDVLDSQNEPHWGEEAVLAFQYLQLIWALAHGDVPLCLRVTHSSWLQHENVRLFWNMICQMAQGEVSLAAQSRLRVFEGKPATEELPFWEVYFRFRKGELSSPPEKTKLLLPPKERTPSLWERAAHLVEAGWWRQRQWGEAWVAPRSSMLGGRGYTDRSSFERMVYLWAESYAWSRWREPAKSASSFKEAQAIFELNHALFQRLFPDTLTHW